MSVVLTVLYNPDISGRMAFNKTNAAIIVFLMFGCEMCECTVFIE